MKKSFSDHVPAPKPSTAEYSLGKEHFDRAYDAAPNIPSMVARELGRSCKFTNPKDEAAYREFITTLCGNAVYEAIYSEPQPENVRALEESFNRSETAMVKSLGNDDWADSEKKLLCDVYRVVCSNMQRAMLKTPNLTQGTGMLQ